MLFSQNKQWSFGDGWHILKKVRWSLWNIWIFFIKNKLVFLWQFNSCPVVQYKLLDFTWCFYNISYISESGVQKNVLLRWWLRGSTPTIFELYQVLSRGNFTPRKAQPLARNLLAIARSTYMYTCTCISNEAKGACVIKKKQACDNEFIFQQLDTAKNSTIRRVGTGFDMGHAI